MHAAIAALIFAATMFTVVVRPRGVSEAWAAGAGAGLMVLTGGIGPLSAAGAVVREWDLFLFFLGLMLTAAVADMAGFFDWAAGLAVKAARGSGSLLLFNVLILGALITTFLSNDATAVILTPVVYTVVTRLRLRVMPYLFAVSFIANSASMTLPISNPINVLTGDTLRATLAVYEAHLLPASLAAIAITIGIFMTLFWRATRQRFDHASDFVMDAVAREPLFFRTVLGGLAVLAIAYIVASALLLPLGVIAATGGAGLVAIAVANRRLSRAHLRAHVSPALFAYIAALFILVRGIEDAGITGALVSGLIARAADPATAVATGLFGSAVTSNVLNNLPGVLVFISGAQAAVIPGDLRTPFLFGALAGADLGPNLTPVGALSTMLWLVIVRGRGVEVSAWDFLRIGAVVTPLTIVAAAALIAFSFR
jgi:arsenical pump membrane protein